MTEYSYQLYSSRKFPPLADTLKMVGELGYTQVEGFGALFNEETDLGALRADLDAADLSMPTAHIGVDVLRDTPGRAVKIAATLGLKAVYAPFLEEAKRPMTADGWRAFGKTLNEIGKPIQDAGLIFGWHNHAFEFGGDSPHPLELMLEAGPDLTLEFDVAWCVVGGQDPLDWIDRYGDRISAAHIKDIAPEGEKADEDGWADVGSGTMDWPVLMAALQKTKCQWFVAEHDNPSDHRRFAETSLAAMRSY